MDTKNLLISNREERLKRILKEYKKTEENLKEDLEVLKIWFKNQPHLPEIPSDNMIMAFLIINKFSIENSKLKLDMYYTLRSLIPEIYQNKNPKLSHMKEVADKIYVIPLPKLTKEGYRVTILKMIYENSDNFDPYNFFGHTYNILEVRLHEDVPSGDILVYDLEYFKMGHILKTTPVSMKKSMLILEKVFSNRVKAMHFINAPPYADRLFAILRPLLKDKMKKRVHVDQKYNAILKSIPKNVLPKDYGGEELSLFELNPSSKTSSEGGSVNLNPLLKKPLPKEPLLPHPLTMMQGSWEACVASMSVKIVGCGEQRGCDCSKDRYRHHVRALFDNIEELWKQKLVEYQDRFDALDKMRTNEAVRPKPLVNDEILGFHGNFKKLSVD